ncbi:unnamed protein product [Mytilus coruscus]|uniref:Mab-21-like HhH/H2TH-like domain-containing protein n=1 Tax=Mytilus coruscus TaxID=42192 RepID=A0A6J8E8M3_MYTCO|nr:unnamed protein product [Mytilus coruscus]
MKHGRDEGVSPALLDQLLERAQTNENIEWHKSIIRGFNAYMSNFTNEYERCEMVGSTVDGTRLRSRTDDGDFDFIVSSCIPISAKLIKQHSTVPCFVKILGEQLNIGTSLIDGFVPTSILKEINPIFYIVSKLLIDLICPSVYYSTGKGYIHSKTDISSLGMSSTNFQTSSQNEFSSARIRLPFKLRLKLFFLKLRYRYAFSTLMLVVEEIEKKRTDRLNSGIVYQMVSGSNNSNNHTCQTTNQDTFIGTKFKYDIVPVFRVIDPEKYLEKWQNRSRKWPPKDSVDQIVEMPMYLAAKRALEESREEVDFCLSFCMLEIALVQNFTPLQKYTFILLKAIHKGDLSEHAEILTTYHWKTAYFLYCENHKFEELKKDDTDVCPFDEVSRVLCFMRECLDLRKLNHFFIEDCNLLISLPIEKLKCIAEKISKIQDSIKCSVRVFWELDYKQEISNKFVDQETQNQSKIKLVNAVEEMLKTFSRNRSQTEKAKNDFLSQL